MMERWNVGVADMRSDEIPCAPREREREEGRMERDCGVLSGWTLEGEFWEAKCREFVVFDRDFAWIL